MHFNRNFESKGFIFEVNYSFEKFETETLNLKLRVQQI